MAYPIDQSAEQQRSIHLSIQIVQVQLVISLCTSDGPVLMSGTSQLEGSKLPTDAHPGQHTIILQAP